MATKSTKNFNIKEESSCPQTTKTVSLSVIAQKYTAFKDTLREALDGEKQNVARPLLLGRYRSVQTQGNEILAMIADNLVVEMHGQETLKEEEEEDVGGGGKGYFLKEKTQGSMVNVRRSLEELKGRVLGTMEKVSQRLTSDSFVDLDRPLLLKTVPPNTISKIPNSANDHNDETEDDDYVSDGQINLSIDQGGPIVKFTSSVKTKSMRSQLDIQSSPSSHKPNRSAGPPKLTHYQPPREIHSKEPEASISRNNFKITGDEDSQSIFDSFVELDSPNSSLPSQVEEPEIIGRLNVGPQVQAEMGVIDSFFASYRESFFLATDHVCISSVTTSPSLPNIKTLQGKMYLLDKAIKLHDGGLITEVALALFHVLSPRVFSLHVAPRKEAVSHLMAYFRKRNDYKNLKEVCCLLQRKEDSLIVEFKTASDLGDSRRRIEALQQLTRSALDEILEDEEDLYELCDLINKDVSLLILQEDLLKHSAKEHYSVLGLEGSILADTSTHLMIGKDSSSILLDVQEDGKAVYATVLNEELTAFPLLRFSPLSIGLSVMQTLGYTTLWSSEIAYFEEASRRIVSNFGICLSLVASFLLILLFLKNIVKNSNLVSATFGMQEINCAIQCSLIRKDLYRAKNIVETSPLKTIPDWSLQAYAFEASRFCSDHRSCCCVAMASRIGALALRFESLGLLGAEHAAFNTLKALKDEGDVLGLLECLSAVAAWHELSHSQFPNALRMKPKYLEKIKESIETVSSGLPVLQYAGKLIGVGARFGYSATLFAASNGHMLISKTSEAVKNVAVSVSTSHASKAVSYKMGSVLFDWVDTWQAKN